MTRQTFSVTGTSADVLWRLRFIFVQRSCSCNEGYEDFVAGVGCTLIDVCDVEPRCHRWANCTTIGPMTKQCVCILFTLILHLLHIYRCIIVDYMYTSVHTIHTMYSTQPSVRKEVYHVMNNYVLYRCWIGRGKHMFIELYYHGCNVRDVCLFQL